jgi:hypothetical protein
LGGWWHFPFGRLPIPCGKWLMKPQQADFAKRLNCQHFTSVISPFVD